jgi:hypothetical protein
MVSRLYSGFRGVDFRGEETALTRSPDSLNVWRNYKNISGVETRPGMKLSAAFSEPVYGVFFYNDMMLVHSGSKLYKVVNGVQTVIYSGLKEQASDSFVFEGIWYFKDGKHYLKYDGNAISAVEGFAPTTSIGRKPAGGGTIHQDVNLLSGRRINTFLADGTSKTYALDAQDIDTDFAPIVKVNGSVVTNYTVSYLNGKINFKEAPSVPATDGQDNVSVEFRKTVKGYADRILNCTLLQVFDNRVFFSGNPDYPNTVWHCSLDDPSYCSDLDYYREGLDTAAVRGLVAGNNALWVFREPSDANTTVFYHTPTLDSDYGKIYPSTHSSISTGCVGKAINFGDDICFFSEKGMEGISGDVTTEQILTHRSSLVDRKLTADANYRDMILAEWEGYLLVFAGKNVYLADSRSAFTMDGHTEYEWHYWQLERSVTCVKVHDGVLYVGTEDGVYSFSDFKADVESYWTTPLDKFKHPNKVKTTNKKSCTVEAVSEEITMLARTNKQSEFETLGTFTNVTDAFNCRIKAKKFKDMQIKFYSPKRFSLESATLEVFIGGYLKNL